MSAPVPSVPQELRGILSRLRLGQMLDTLPERLATARAAQMPHFDFLEMVLADEVARRDRTSAGVRAKAAHLDPNMLAEAWDDTASVLYDRTVWAELTTLRFVEEHHNALILGPVGVGKTFLATALGHIACRRRFRVHFERADKLCKRLKAARLDQSAEAEMRRLVGMDLLILDDFALHPLDVTETNDFYELVVERHRKGATVLTSNRDPSEFLAQMADPLLAQSAVDRLQSAAYELVIEGESYRKRQKPKAAPIPSVTDPSRARRRPTG
jgi:DNA replication protein DnaC